MNVVVVSGQSGLAQNYCEKKNMIKSRFFNYINQDKNYHIATKSVFGELGIFVQDAMFALITPSQVYLRGTPDLDPIFKKLNCNKYVLEKKQSTSIVNYYDISALFMPEHPDVGAYIDRSKNYAVREQASKKCFSAKRMRDLPNIHLSIERMAKKAGIRSVQELYELGAVKAFVQMKQLYGESLDTKILWKFYGALNGLYWELIQDPQRNTMLEEVRFLESLRY